MTSARNTSSWSGGITPRKVNASRSATSKLKSSRRSSTRARSTSGRKCTPPPASTVFNPNSFSAGFWPGSSSRPVPTRTTACTSPGSLRSGRTLRRTSLPRRTRRAPSPGSSRSSTGPAPAPQRGSANGVSRTVAASTWPVPPRRERRSSCSTLSGVSSKGTPPASWIASSSGRHKARRMRIASAAVNRSSHSRRRRSSSSAPRKTRWSAIDSTRPVAKRAGSAAASCSAAKVAARRWRRRRASTSAASKPRSNVSRTRRSRLASPSAQFSAGTESAAEATPWPKISS